MVGVMNIIVGLMAMCTGGEATATPRSGQRRRW